MNQTDILQVGASRECITPPLGTELYGYPSSRPALSVGDDLHIIAAAFVCGDTKAIVLSADVCTVSETFVNEVKNEIAEQTGFPADQIIYNVTHTHSGPYTSTRYSGWGKPEFWYLDGTLRPMSVKVAVDAVNNIRPVVCGVGTTQSDVAANRRTIKPDGKVGLGQNPWGVEDREMTVLSFKEVENNQTYLNIVHYGCHGTAAGANREISRDWPGAMKDVMERETGALTMFIQGPIGETGPRCPNGSTTQNYQVALELGYKAGMDAVRAWRSIKKWSNEPLEVVVGKVTVPYEPLPSKEEALAELEKLGTEEELWAQDKRFELNEYYRWKGVADEYEKASLKTHYEQQQCIIAIGDVAIVPFQFEIFLYTPLQLRRYSKFTHTLSLSVTNGSLSYLPSQDQICRGGYEVWSFRVGNTYKLVDDADTYLVTENLKLLDEAYQRLQEA